MTLRRRRARCWRRPGFSQPRQGPRYFIAGRRQPYGRFGRAFAETDLDCANYEPTIADLMTGQHSDLRRVVMFNPDTDRAEDVSHAIAQEILRRLDLERRNVPSELEGFIDHHVGTVN